MDRYRPRRSRPYTSRGLGARAGRRDLDPAHAIDLETETNQLGVFADLPKLAVDDDAVYLTHNATPFDDAATLERWIWRLPRDAETGALPEAPMTPRLSVAPEPFAQTSSVLPVADPEDGNSLVVALERWGENTAEKARIATIKDDGDGPEVESTVVTMGDLTDAGRLPDVEQPGSAPSLFTPNLAPTSGVIRDDTLTIAFTLPGQGHDVGQQTAHWAQFDVTTPTDPRVLDAGAIDGEALGAGTHTYLPSVAVNGSGDVAIAFQAAGPNLPPGFYATVHKADAPDGRTTDPVALAPGETAWSTQLGHWGDSADAAVDPRDDTTFWATNSIVTGDQAWAAPVAHFTTADPVGVSQLPGTFDVRAIDALIATQEAGQVPQAERADVAGTTAYKWGGSAGEGVALTYSFAGPETTFSDTYDARTDDIREAPEGFKETVHESLDSWSDVADVTFTEVQGGGDIQIVITGSHPRFEDGKQRGEAFGPAPGPRAGDVWLSPEAAEEWDAALIHHELAHPIFGFMDTSAAAGLSGATLPPETNFRTHTVMSYEVLPGHEVGNEPGAKRGGAEPWPDTPMVLDIQAAQALYGANDSHNSDNDVYTFDGDAVHRTIWDASGKDRLDASGQTDPVTIDLRPGKYSDVGAPVDIQVADGGHTLEHTLGIAHGTVVENADGGTGDDRLTGNAAHNVLRGGRGSDEIDGGDGRDVLHGNGLGGTDDAPDVLDGGPDVDTAAFEVTHDSAEVGEDGGVRTVSIDGTVDKLIDVERLQFADGTLAFDADGSSGQVYRLYEAVFDRVPEAEGLGFWVKQLDGGERSYREMVESFLAAPEYAERYGAGQSDTAFVETVYRNVLDRAPDNAGNAYWLDQLAEGMPRAKMIADFAESDENRIAVNTAFEDGVWLV